MQPLELKRPETEEERAPRRLLSFLESRKDDLSPLLIATHNFPDPDAMASAFALKFLAKEGFGIDSRIVYGGMIGRTENREMAKQLKIPLNKLKATDFKRFPNIALVDTQPKFQNNSFPGNRRATLVIDQHPPDVEPAADCAIVDPNCGATSVILAQALLLREISLPTNLATALAYGILSDTLDLSRVRRKDVIRAYLDILPQCDMKLLARIRNPFQSRSYFSNVGRGVRNAVVFRRLIVSQLGRVRHPDSVSQMADFLLTYEKVTWSFCTGRFQGRLHVSLRTQVSDANAGETLRDIFDNRKAAGGHGNIAGGSLTIGKDKPEEIWREAEETLQARLVKRLRISSRIKPRRAFNV